MLNNQRSNETPQVQKSNIKVCVRVRPQNINAYSSPIFSAQKCVSSKGHSSSRQSGLVRQRLFQDQEQTKTKSTPAVAVPQDQLLTNRSSSINKDDFLSWIVQGHTIRQSEETNPDYTRSSSYTVDDAFDGNTRTNQLYLDCIQPIVMASLKGYHGSVFAYGQTSTGKTYTMQGNNTEPGVVPLAIHDCFRYISENTDHHREFLLRVSYMEIYNEQINDLLHPGSSSSSSIRIFESKSEGIVIRGLKEEVVVSPQQVFALIAAGEAQRHVGATSMNKHSSRSHTIFRLLIESKDLRRSNRQRSGKGDPVRVSSLSLVDLAGSECIKNTNSTGQRKAEGQYINKSLATLGHVVWKLSEISRTGSVEHIPYRDSKLTRLLQPSLSGNAQVAIICTISPSCRYVDESHNTLKFATRAKRIKQEASVTDVIDENTMLQQYQEEIANLKQRLQDLESQKPQQEEGKDDFDEVQESIADAIHNLDRLILKTRDPNNVVDSLVEQYPVMDNNFSIHLDQTTLSTPNEKENRAHDTTLEKELQKVKILLGSALKKKDANGGILRSAIKTPIAELKEDPIIYHVEKPGKNDSDREEVLRLKHLLHEHEVQASLRKADSEFLQQKLNEKEKLLTEVADVLERVELQQHRLEEDNTRLEDELKRTKSLLKAKEEEIQTMKV